MKQHKKLKITLLVLAGLAVLLAGAFCTVMIISNSPSHIAQLVLDGDPDNKLNEKYDKLKPEKKAEVLTLVTAEMQKKIDDYKAGNVTDTFEAYVGDAWSTFEYIILNSSDVDASKIEEAENVVHDMELIVYGQELISEAESYIAEKDYAEAYELIAVIEGTGGQAEDDTGNIYERLSNADTERVDAVKTAITNEAAAYYIEQCRQLSEENNYAEIEKIIERVSTICSEEDIAVMQEFIFTREKAFDLYLASPADYATLLANGDYNYADAAINFYGYYDVDGDSLNELVFSNINKPEWDTANCYYIDFDETQKNLESAKPVDYGLVKSGIEWVALNDSVDWKNAYTELLLEIAVKERDEKGYDLHDIDGNGIPELIIPFIGMSNSPDEYTGVYSYVNGNLKQYIYITEKYGSTYIYNNNWINFHVSHGVSPSGKGLSIATYTNGVFVDAPTYTMYNTVDGPEHIIRSTDVSSNEQDTEISLNDMNDELKQYGVYITYEYIDMSPYDSYYDYSINFNTDDVIQLKESAHLLADYDYDATQTSDIIESIWNY
ncbi:MAG: hypothetical protein NC428_08465 [Clostridium sp.]|nr:hypothetical protein [Clostridium sp.]